MFNHTREGGCLQKPSSLLAKMMIAPNHIYRLTLINVGGREQTSSSVLIVIYLQPNIRLI